MRVGGKDGRRPRRSAGPRGCESRPRSRGRTTALGRRSRAPRRRDLAVADVTNSGELDSSTPGALWVRRRATGYTALALAAGERVVPFDVDADGDLDLYVSAASGDHLLRNNLDGTWTDVTAAAGHRRRESRRGGAVAADFDRDGDVGPAPVRARTADSLLYDNLRGGRLALREAGCPKRARSCRRGRRSGRRRARRPRLDGGRHGAFGARRTGATERSRPPAASAAGSGAAALRLRQRRIPGPLSGSGATAPRRSARNDGTGSVRAPRRRRAARRRARPRPWMSTATAISTSSSSRPTGGGGALREPRAATRTAGSTSRSRVCPRARPRSTASATARRSRLSAQELYVYRVASRPVTRLGPRRPPPRRRAADRVDQRHPAERARPAGADGAARGPAAQGLLPVPLRLRRRALALRDGRPRPRAGGPPLRRRPPGARGHARVARRPRRIGCSRPTTGALDARLHRGALGDGLLRSGRAVGRGSPGRRRARRRTRRWCRRPSREKKLFTVSRPADAARRSTATGRDRTAEIASRRRRLPRPASRRRATRASSRRTTLVLELPEARGAGTGHALSHRLDPLRRHVDQRVALAAPGPAPPSGPVLEVPDGKGGWKTAIAVDGLSGGQDEDHAGRSVRACSIAPTRACGSAPTSRSTGIGSSTRSTRRRRRCAGRVLPLVSAELSFRGFSRMTRESPDGAAGLRARRRLDGSRAGRTWPGSTRASATCASS